MNEFCANLFGLILKSTFVAFVVAMPWAAIAQPIPVIVQQPQSQSVLAGSNATFNADATGQSPLSYFWFFNGTNLNDGGRISGASTASLNISNLVGGDAGNYHVIVSNKHGIVTSDAAALTVLFPPSIATQPTNQSVVLNSNVAFTVLATGTAPLSYQWTKNGTNILDGGNLNGSTSASLSISGIQAGDAGDYSVIMSNAYGVATSLSATLTVLFPPSITVQPANRYVAVTRNTSFTVAVTGMPPLHYQWFFNGNPLSDGGRVNGALASTLTIENVQTNDAGGYQVVVSSDWGAVTSSIATLAVGIMRYVNVSSANPVAPYTNWAIAATVIQDAIDVSEPGDEIIVTNGTYSTGGRAVNGTLVSRVAVDRPITLRSVNGPAFTIIQGLGGPASSAIRCAYLTNDAMLSGFTLTGGGTRTTTGDFFDRYGGGVFCASVSAVVSNCTISGNIARNAGGGAYSGTLNNCVFTSNFANNGSGGAASSSTLNNCTISGNSANAGGGASYSTLNNCIVTGNSATGLGQGGGTYSCTLLNCTVANNNAADYGGGAAWGVLINCVVSSNNAPNSGGGASGANLTNCLVVGNSARFGGGVLGGSIVNCTVTGNTAVPSGQVGGGGLGGGVYGGTMINSIVYYNSGISSASNWSSMSAIVNSCTLPLPGGDGNISADPLFLDRTNGNYRLQASSPCVDSGTNEPVVTGFDLDRLPRLVDEMVDMGAYEFQHVPFVVVPPVSQSVLLSSNVVFTAYAVGDEPLAYQWQKDGVNISDDMRVSGTTTASLAISNLVIQDAGGYRVIVTNASGSVTSAVATLTLLGLPSISVQPVNRTVPAGTNVSFSVVASGLTTLSYQWRFEEALLVNATNSSLALTNVQFGNAGDYDVVVSSSYGMVTSAVATLTVVPSLPTFTTQPVSRVASLQQNFAFSVAAKGTEPMTCQWQKNGSDIAGETNFTLNFLSAQYSDAGVYRSVVSNSVGFVLSAEATLSVVPIVVWGRTNFNALQISASATSVVAMAVADGALVVLRANRTLAGWGQTNVSTDATNVVAIAVGGSAGIQLQSTLQFVTADSNGTVRAWGYNGFGITNPPPSATNVVAVSVGSRHALALRGDGSVVAWGDNRSLQTNVPVSATNVVAIAAGSSHSLALRADGKVVGWGLNGNKSEDDLAGALNVIAIASGGNQVMGLGVDGTILGFVVTNGGPPGVLYGQPPATATNVTEIAAGSTHTLGLRPEGVVVGWGANVFAGVTNIPTYATNAVAIAAGGYNSLALIRDPLTPIPPSIGREPVSRTVFAGQSIVVHALALGALPLSHQWNFEGALLPEQTNSWLVLTNVQVIQSGDYQLVVTNDFGSVTSVVATVTVSAPPPVMVNPVFNAGGLHLSFFAFADAEYVLEFKEQLEDFVWQELQEITGAGAVITLTDPTPLDASRFYRVRVK